MVQSEEIYPGLEVIMLGTSITPTSDIQWHYNQNKDVMNRLAVMKRFESLCKEYGLPVRIAHETIRIMMKKNKHWYSERKQIKIFLSVLDMDYRYIYKARAIKQKYEMATGI